uniref:Major sperm protein n=1 Tax=Caenorhabditis tropicalis TaxID=1561998 RepID=A0A1I7TEN1_9PELO
MTDKKQFIATDPSDKIKFLAETQEEQKATLKITNQSEMKQAFKVKCTRNDLFRIKPSTGILDYNQTLTVILTYRYSFDCINLNTVFRGGQSKPPTEKQQFGVYHIPAPENCTCEGAWAEHCGPPQGEHKLKVVWNE